MPAWSKNEEEQDTKVWASFAVSAPFWKYFLGHKAFPLKMSPLIFVFCICWSSLKTALQKIYLFYFSGLFAEFRPFSSSFEEGFPALVLIYNNKSLPGKQNGHQMFSWRWMKRSLRLIGKLLSVECWVSLCMIWFLSSKSLLTKTFFSIWRRGLKYWKGLRGQTEPEQPKTFP